MVLSSYLSNNAVLIFPHFIEHLGKKKVPGKGHHESEGIWDYGYSKLFTSTNHADFKPKKVDPRVKPQRPIKSGVFGAGIDHISFLEFEDAEIIFRRRLGHAVKEKPSEKDSEKVRLTSTNQQDFTASGFIVDDHAHLGKAAGRPTRGPAENSQIFPSEDN
ncbi:hypothetical protein HDU77_001017 [Chytriomyces hyalinus]|nr:hypothetical protein HDU77_001017 [Chytriomyces hyalinus]